MTPPTTKTLTDEGRRGLLSTMVLIRTYEEAIRREYYADKKPAFDIGAGLVPGEMHLSAGQEPVAAGICAHLTPEDALTATHRPHHVAIAKGVALRPMTAEIFGRHGTQGNALRDGHVVWPVGGGERVFWRQMRADPRGDRLLASREVHLSRNQSRADVEGGLLVGIVLTPDRLFVRPDQHHGADQCPSTFVGEDLCGEWRHFSSSCQVRRRCRTPEAESTPRHPPAAEGAFQMVNCPNRAAPSCSESVAADDWSCRIVALRSASSLSLGREIAKEAITPGARTG